MSTPRRPCAVLAAIAILAALLTAAPASGQGGAGPTLQIQPPQDGEADVNLNDRIRISGSGFPDGAISSGRLIGLRADGGQVEQAISGLNSPASETASYLRNDGGTISGRQRLGSIFANPREDWCLPDTFAAPPPERVVQTFLEIELDGRHASNTLRVDFCQPALVRYDVVAPDTIRAVFSEPVRYADEGLFNDSGLDWDITEPTLVVTDVQAGTNDCQNALEHPNRDGCTRILTLSQAVGEDATPRVRYEPGARPQYVDFANGSLQPDSFERIRALDRIRPRKPGVVSIAGRAPVEDSSAPTGRRVLGNQPAPVVELDTLTAGHRVEVRSSGSLLTSAQASGSTLTVTLPSLGPDGPYDLTFVAIDAAGNRSTDVGSPPGQDGRNNPVTYVLDTLRPRVTAAAQTGDGGRQVLVTFSEPLQAEPVAAGTWRLDGTEPTAVEAGEASNQRLLTFERAPAAGATLSWEGSDGDRYADLAGNPLADLSGFPVLVVPPPAVPSFTLPEPGVVTNAADIAVTGTVDNPNGRPLAVEIFGDRETTNRVAGPFTVSGGQWSGTAPLPGGMPADTDVTLYARTLDTALGLRSPLPPAASNVVTVDRVVPEDVAVTQPTSDSVLGGPAAPVGPGLVEVEWTASDPNPGSFQLTLTDAAGAVTPCSTGQWSGEGPYRGTCDIAEDAAEGNATVTVTAIDAAGNSTSAGSVPIPIDTDIVGALATLSSNGATANPGEITIAYSEPLSGMTTGGDWRANDGRNGQPDRMPLAAAASGGSVTLRFGQPFPGGADGGHPNAQPRYTYPGPLVGPRLQSSGGDPIPVAGTAFDITPPALALQGVPQLHNGVRARQDIPGCGNLPADPAVPPCPGSGPVLLLRGTTDSALDANGNGSFDPNELNDIVVYRGDASFVDGPQPVRLADALVGADGSFTAIVPLAANQQQTFTVIAQDINPNGLKAEVRQVVTLTEDSLGPVITQMSARLSDGGTVVIPMQFSEIVSTTDLSYRVGGGVFQPIDTVAFNADAGTYRWTPPQDLNLAAGLQISAAATDQLGNLGVPRVVGLGDLAQLISATAIAPDTVVVTTSEPVTTAAPGNAGFAVPGGPGVRATSVQGNQITLTLNDDLQAGSYDVAYNATGDWVTTDGRPLEAGTVPLLIAGDGFLFPVTGLAAGPAGGGGAVVSFVDDRNQPDDVQAYEVTRDAAVVAELPAGERILVDSDAPDGAVTYTVVVVGTSGARSEPRSVTVVLGDSPVSDGRGDDGGTGAPPGSEPVEDCPFPAEPNITAGGGTVLSCDGRVAVLAPPSVTDGDLFAKLVRRTTVPTAGFRPATDLYQLIAVTDTPDFATVDTLAGYTEMSFRALGPELAEGIPERTTVLRAFDTDAFDELAARIGTESVAHQLLTLGTFGVVEADGGSVRVFGPDPAIPPDRFATAAGLSQTQRSRAATVVLARADDYPDALAAAPLSSLLGGPVLLARTEDVPQTTLLELRRLETEEVWLVGGTAALSAAVEQQLAGLGYRVVRVAGETRFHTAAAVAERVGSVDATAYLATGGNFADALSASAPAAAALRPILLSQTDALHEQTRIALDRVIASTVHVVGGEAAITGGVSEGLASVGFTVRRSAGATRYGTAVALAQDMIADGLLSARQPLMASGEGDGRTSPDALAAGPVGGRLGTPLLLTPEAALTDEVQAFLSAAAGLRGTLIAGGPAAVSDQVRAQVDASSDR